MRKTAVQNVVRNVSKNVKDAATEIEQISASSQEAAATAEDLAKTSAQAANKVQDTGEILAISQNIASQIKLLSLNASIEAARAGAYGRGFAVVASEMQKLAQGSTDATNHIKQILNEIKQVNQNVISGIQQFTIVSREQAQGLQYILKSRHFISRMALQRPYTDTAFSVYS